jgi:hypothetical protein
MTLADVDRVFGQNVERVRVERLLERGGGEVGAARGGGDSLEPLRYGAGLRGYGVLSRRRGH